tara:strand:- start:12864 stop:13955 length:1092 start_codon:yes stop_codon:yes gene_type:complete
MQNKVLVAMSGGVDSSVALIKILEMGYDPIGVTMKLWDYKDVGGKSLPDSNCCSVGAINNAKLVCDKFSVPHYTIDFTKVFLEKVVKNFSDEYLSGRTPNPCVRCNSFVKWDAFLQQAEELGASKIATGHYAKIIKKNNNYSLAKGSDSRKDQAYVLWGIPRGTLNKTIFPLGDMTKNEVRKIAIQNRLETAHVPESMDICFVADNNYSRFLNDFSNDKVSKINQGEIKNSKGEILGQHTGYHNYTIGQRKGLGLSMPQPNYVNKIDAKTNTIVIGEKTELLKNSCSISQVNWLKENIKFPLKVSAQIRYNSKEVDALVSINKHNAIDVKFEKPQLAITPGQSIVFYDNNTVLGGGIISKICS